MWLSKCLWSTQCLKGAALDARDTKLKSASSVLSGTHCLVAERDGSVGW